MSIKSVFDRMKAKAPKAISEQATRITKGGQHGEAILVRVHALPNDLLSVKPVNGRLIVAHSESGNHHMICADEAEMFVTEDAETAYLRIVNEAGGTVFQERAAQPHNPQAYEQGIWRVTYARELDLAGQIRRSMD